MTQESQAVADYKKWILKQENPAYKIAEKDSRHIELVSAWGTAEINFYDEDLVEISITAAKSGENKFWLHFQVNDMEHAHQLFNEMKDALLSLEHDSQIKVLLSCSSAFTTSFFASKLSEAAKTLELDFSFHAVPVSTLYEEGARYDIILIAPQVGFMLKKLREAFPDKPVEQIPTALFASYDTLKMLEFIENSLEAFRLRKEALICNGDICYPKSAQSQERILVIAVKNEDMDSSRIYFRVYDKGSIVLDDMVRKPRMHVLDLTDIIDTVLARFKVLDMIGIATPGMVNEEGDIVCPARGHKPCDLEKDLREKYKIPVYVANNANAAVWGFHKEHPEYANVIYHSQPFGHPDGGQGYIIHHQLHTGKDGIAGELRFYIDRMQFSDAPSVLAKTDLGMLELVSKSLLVPITVIGPDIIAVKSLMTSDMKEIKQKLASFIDWKYLPEFVYIADDRDYLLNGQLDLCLLKMHEKKKEKEKDAYETKR